MLQRVVDLAELDPSATDLHLVVGATHEDQAFGFKTHQVATAVRAVPAECGHGGVLLGIFGRVEIPGQTHSTDHQLADLAGRNGLPVAIDHCEVPAGQRQTDADRHGAVELRGARHHGRLGGAVGVPHLAAVDGKTGTELGRAGLAAEDQQSHRFEGLRWPQRRQGRHRRDNSDVTLHQPRPEVHTRPHEGTWRRHQACAVAPGEPHLFAGRVERDRQAGQHPIARTQRLVLQEHLGLGIDERGGIAVGHRHTLRRPRGTGGEDDPCVVLDGRSLGIGRPVDVAVTRTRKTQVGWPPQTVGSEDRRHLGLAEDECRPLGWIVGVHRNVGGTGRQRREDGQVQLA